MVRLAYWRADKTQPERNVPILPLNISPLWPFYLVTPIISQRSLFNHSSGDTFFVTQFHSNSSLDRLFRPSVYVTGKCPIPLCGIGGVKGTN